MSESLSSFGNLMLLVCAWVLHKTGLPIEQVSILGVLLALDYFTGIGKSLVIGRPVTSRIGWVGLLSKTSILIIPLVLALMAKGVGIEFVGFVEYSISLLILNESYSVLANIYAIKEKKELPEWSVIELILRKIQEAAESLLEKK